MQCLLFLVSPKDKQSSYQQLLVKAKLPSLYNRRLQDICILMYKVKHNLCPRTICDMFLTNSHAYNLRHKDFYQPSFNTVTHGKHSIRYLGPRLWSKIPSKDRSAPSLKQFKTRIRSLDLSSILDGCSGCYLCNSQFFLFFKYDFNYKILEFFIIINGVFVVCMLCE